MRSVNFRIEGMHCQGCADRVRKILWQLPAVLAARRLGSE